jgi:hypothetical protein
MAHLNRFAKVGVAVVAGGVVLSGVEGVNLSALDGQGSPTTQEVSTLVVEVQEPIFVFASAEANESVTTVLNDLTCSGTGGHSNFNAGAGFMGFNFHFGTGGSTGMTSDPALLACQLEQFMQNEVSYAAFAASIKVNEDERVALGVVEFTIFLLGEGDGVSFATADQMRAHPIESLPLAGVLIRNGGEVQSSTAATTQPATQPAATQPVVQPTSPAPAGNPTLQLN